VGLNLGVFKSELFFRIGLYRLPAESADAADVKSCAVLLEKYQPHWPY